jgi:hypothetical protein
MIAESNKGNGQPGTDQTRWLMKNGDGSQWETTGYYTQAEIECWELSRPVRPIPNEQVTT